MSFLKKLFGLNSPGASGSWEAPAEEMEHAGFRIAAMPQKEGGQYRLCGEITKEIGGETKTHQLIRADLFQSKDECVQFTVRKAKQVIDEQGEKIFS